jgi:hypothetical protein
MRLIVFDQHRLNSDPRDQRPKRRDASLCPGRPVPRALGEAALVLHHLHESPVMRYRVRLDPINRDHHDGAELVEACRLGVGICAGGIKDDGRWGCNHEFPPWG